LYPVDAGPHAAPAWIFQIDPGQELPPLAPGARVSVRGALAQGAMPSILADGIEVHPASPLASGRVVPMFAECADVVHPAAVGWDDKWRPAVVSLRSISDWTRDLTFDTRFVWYWVFLFTVYAIAFGTATATVLRSGLSPLFFVGVLLILPLYAWLLRRRARGLWLGWRARRTLASLRHATTALAGPSRRMWMRLRWTVGYGMGALAVADLYPTEDGATATASLAVCNLPSGFTADERVPVDVFGDPNAAAVIRHGSTELWPADPRYQRARVSVY
jgi:hypothetical protein